MKRFVCISVWCVIAGLCVVCLAIGCGDGPGKAKGKAQRAASTSQAEAPQGATAAAAAQSPPIVSAARSQIGRTTIYDPAYVRLAYPGGDVPIEKGVCTDVVVRAFRDALGQDLQKLVHEDMLAAFSDYPQKWGLSKPDANIDHRRVPNLARYFTRKGWAVAVTRKNEDYRAGDLVTCTVPPALPHIMIVSDRKNAQGVPLVIHNIGLGTREEDRLFEFPITGHYRIPADAQITRPE
jgi:uncharacterized protein